VIQVCGLLSGLRLGSFDVAASVRFLVELETALQQCNALTSDTQTRLDSWAEVLDSLGDHRSRVAAAELCLGSGAELGRMLTQFVLKVMLN